jgi:hypothetical protein
VTLSLITLVLSDFQFAISTSPLILSSFKNALVSQHFHYWDFLRSVLLELLEATNSEVEEKYRDVHLKDLTLAIVIVITSWPDETFIPTIHQSLVSLFKKLQKNNSAEVQLLAAQSMKACILLSCKQLKEKTTIGDVYVRLFLPLLIANIDQEIDLVVSGNLISLQVIEDELKTLLVLSLTHPINRSSTNS